ncbi:MAG: guanine deaminase [Bacteroidales bacterium]
MIMKQAIKIVRGDIFDFLGEYTTDAQKPVARYIVDGALAIRDGKVEAVDRYSDILKSYPEAEILDYSGKLIMPGFIDTHIHFPQTEIIGSFGHQLIDWLNHYAFPVEREFRSKEKSDMIAKVFLKELFRNGTTSCMAFSTVHKESVNALFEAASEFNMRMITGRVTMNRNGDGALLDNGDSWIEESRELINRWHGVGRNLYAFTPRFAVSCDMDSMKMLGEMHKEFPGTYIQTHISENSTEVSMIKALYPECEDYLAVYEEAGLITDHTFLAHGIHLSDSELSRIAKAGATITHCPTSNNFLGSGLFDMNRAHQAGVQSAIATDVGGGTSFSMLQTLGESYKVQHVQGYTMDPFEAYYRATLGAARALKIDHLVGNFESGKEADFVVFDCEATVPQRLRREFLERTNQLDIQTTLFGLQIMGDDRNIIATYIMGEKVHDINE